MPTTPCWPKSEVGPDGFKFPSTFQDSFHRQDIAEEAETSLISDDVSTSEKNRLDRVRKGSALTINMPASSSGYESVDSMLKQDTFTIDMKHEQNNLDNKLQEQEGFLDKRDGQCEDSPSSSRRRNTRDIQHSYLLKIFAGLGIVTLTSLSIVGLVFLILNFIPNDEDSPVGVNKSVTPVIHVDIPTTPKPPVVDPNPPVPPPTREPNTPIVGIRMIVDENYAESGSDAVVLWEKPKGELYQGITYQNGYFTVSVSGYYSYRSVLKIDTRHLKPASNEILFHHCVQVKETTLRSCSSNGIPVGAIRSSSTEDSLVYLTKGQEVFVTINRFGLISNSHGSNTFTMNLMYTKNKISR